jgi:hypothetical protein
VHRTDGRLTWKEEWNGTWLLASDYRRAEWRISGNYWKIMGWKLLAYHDLGFYFTLYERRGYKRSMVPEMLVRNEKMIFGAC